MKKTNAPSTTFKKGPGPRSGYQRMIEEMRRKPRPLSAPKPGRAKGVAKPKKAMPMRKGK